MIFREFSVKYDESKIDISFFAGTMFWFSPRALSGIHAANRNVLEFESENGKQDGTLAHAWERAFCGIARAAGYTISTIEMGGKELQDIDGIYNTVDAVD